MRLAILYESEVARRNLEYGIERAAWLELLWCVRRPEQVAEGLLLGGVDAILVESDGAPDKVRMLNMADMPPLLLVSDTQQGNAAEAFEALGLGARDVVSTDGLYAQRCDAFDPARRLEEKLKTIARLLGLRPGSEAKRKPAVVEPEMSRQRFTLVLIGCSTGGPAALEKLFSAIPTNSNLAVVVAQHLDDGFVDDFVSWLAGKSHMKVVEAREGMVPVAGELHISRTDRHLTIDANGHYRYQQEPVAYAYRPSINVLFESATHYRHGPMLALLLTGMGRDGAEGLLALRKAGVPTIAQDEQSCAVYGMPKAAAAMGAALQVRSLSEITTTLVELAKGES